MRGRKSGRSSFFCKQQVAPSIDPALAGEKPVRPIRAPGFSRAGESAEVFRLASIRRQVLQALLSPTVPQDRRRQTPLQSVLWLSLLRGAGQSPILLFLLILLACRGSSARRVLPAPRETFRCARVSPGLRANLRALFPATMDSLSETARPFRQFSCARLQTVSRKRAPAVRLKRFLCVPFREVFLKCLEFLFPSNPSAQRSLRAQVLAARAPSLAPEFPRGGQQLQTDIDSPGLAEFSRCRENHSSFQCGVFNSRKIHRGALARRGAFHGFSAGLHAAHAQPFAARKQFHFVPRRDASGNQSARHHGAKSFHRKRTINRKPEISRCVFRGCACSGVT